MDKYIKADDLLNAIYPVDPENDGSDGCTVVARPLTLTSEELEAMIDNLPAADVAPVVHGAWLPHRDYLMECSGFWVCSKCKKMARDKSTYCMHCGAKMDLEE